MKLEIRSLLTYISATSNGTLDSCLNWTISIDYSFQSYANIESKLSSRPSECLVNDKLVYLEQDILFANGAVLILSLISLGFSWTQIYEISKEYMRYKRKINEEKNKEVEPDYVASRLTANIDW